VDLSHVIRDCSAAPLILVPSVSTMVFTRHTNGSRPPSSSRMPIDPTSLNVAP
jgi:hypothetical protein